MVTSELKDGIVWLIIEEKMVLEDVKQEVGKWLSQKETFSGFITDGGVAQAKQLRQASRSIGPDQRAGSVDSDIHPFDESKGHPVFYEPRGRNCLGQEFRSVTGAKKYKCDQQEGPYERHDRKMSGGIGNHAVWKGQVGEIAQ
jgi:hypothetical protein